jgi:hypothetical protein
MTPAASSLTATSFTCARYSLTRLPRLAHDDVVHTV